MSLKTRLRNGNVLFVTECVSYACRSYASITLHVTGMIHVARDRPDPRIPTLHHLITMYSVDHGRRKRFSSAPSPCSLQECDYPAARKRESMSLVLGFASSIIASGSSQPSKIHVSYPPAPRFARRAAILRSHPRVPRVSVYVSLPYMTYIGESYK